MIRNQWYVILESGELPPTTPVGVTRLGERLVLFRSPLGQVGCLADPCAHRSAALSAGRVIRDQIQCPFHGLQYDVTGRCRLIPANGRLTAVPEEFRVGAYPARDAHGLIWIWWGEPQPDLPSLPFFPALDASFHYTTFVDNWPVHYSRAVENQLDVVHLPFVHASTIGRGGRTLVDGPLVRMVDGGIDVWVYNRVDDGTAPLRAKEIPTPSRGPFLEFRFPNIWQLCISDKVRIFLAFVPIDEENTRLYLRYYQRVTRIPVVRQLVTWFGMRFSRVVLAQDKRVVRTQRPRRTSLKMGEKLIQGDSPIVAYRRQRAELLGETEAGGRTQS